MNDREPEHNKDLDENVRLVVRVILERELVLFLGAGASCCDRPPGAAWHPGNHQLLPRGNELADHLATTFELPRPASDLARASQHVAVALGFRPLYRALHRVFAADYPPTSLHRLIARLPSLTRAKSPPLDSDPAFCRRLLVITTNYDDLMERAFRAENEPFHTLIYQAEGERERRGKFVHLLPGGGQAWIEVLNNYSGLMDHLPIVLKIHGAVDRTDGKRDSYVITEDHYIEYLTRTDATSLLPPPLPALLKDSHLLFLGYSLRDWNLRVILHRLWGNQDLSHEDRKSWAIQQDCDDVDVGSWSRRGVKILKGSLEDYVSRLELKLELLPDGGVAPCP